MLEDEIVLDKKFKHDISVVVDRLVMRHDVRKRLADSIETAVALADGMVEIETVPREGDGDAVTLYSEKFACPDHGPVDPRARAADLLVQLAARRVRALHGPGLADGDRPRAGRAGPDAVDRRGRARAVGERARRNYYEQITEAIAEKYGIDLEAPWDDARPRTHASCSCTAPNGDRIQVSYRNRYGRRRSYATRFEGIVPNLERRYRETDSESTREKIEEFMSLRAVPGVQGRAPAAGVARGARRRHRASTSSRR